MSKSQFSKQEMAFFEEGDTLSDNAVAEDVAELNHAQTRSTRWASRALAMLSLVGPARSES
tara:strand:- start:11506 stop:11688 length:183 start_codon:yes stop_codon:yes gene_type:complete